MDFSQIGPHLFLGESPKNIDDYATMMDRFDVIIEFNAQDDIGDLKIAKIITNDKKLHEKTLSPEDQAALARNVALFKQAYADRNISFAHFYLDDTDGRGMARIFWAAYEVFTRERRNLPSANIYVHCKSGVHRSAHFLIFTLMLEGWSYADAFALIASKRPVIEERDSLKTQLQTLFHEKVEHGE